MRTTVTCAVLLVLLMHSATIAQLTWGKSDQSLKAELGAKEVKATYPFTNTGKYAVTITHVRPSCDCTAATLQKRVYKPGESGELPVTFTIGTRQGVQRKQILVETDETKSNQTVLMLSVDVPKVVKVDQPFLYWTVGEAEPKPQRFTVTMARPVKVTEVRAMGGLKVKTAIKEIKANEQYEIEVTPPAGPLTKPGQVTLELMTDQPQSVGSTRLQVLVRPEKPTTRPSKAEKPQGGEGKENKTPEPASSATTQPSK